jgi:hypothetical protein
MHSLLFFSRLSQYADATQHLNTHIIRAAQRSSLNIPIHPHDATQ